MRWPTGSAWACSCAVVLALAGCGGGPTLPPATAARLAGLAGGVAEALDRGRTCSASRRAGRLQTATIDAINAGMVPGQLQEELLGRVNELAGRIPCPGTAPTVARRIATELSARIRDLAG